MVQSEEKSQVGKRLAQRWKKLTDDIYKKVRGNSFLP